MPLVSSRELSARANFSTEHATTLPRSASNVSWPDTLQRGRGICPSFMLIMYKAAAASGMPTHSNEQAVLAFSCDGWLRGPG